MILHTNLYHFILKYNIYIFICKLDNFLKFGWLLLKPFSSSLLRGYSNVKVLYGLQRV
jgi:hypothetical protein